MHQTGELLIRSQGKLAQQDVDNDNPPLTGRSTLRTSGLHHQAF
jgi:hypothetical protein